MGAGLPRVVTISLVVGLAVVRGAGVAAAPSPSGTGPSPEIRAAAIKKLQVGADLMKRGEFQEALASFKSAYELVPNPKIQYNFGLAYMALGRSAEALDAFDRFLAGAIDADHDHVRHAHQHRASLSKKVGRVVVTCPVDGASVFVDGRPFGNTPLARPILLDPGPHLLLVEKPGSNLPFTHRFEIAAGASLEVAARLAGEAGTSTPKSSVAPVPAPPVESSALAASRGTTAIPRDDGGGPPGWSRPVAWVAAGVGAASIAFGAYQWTIKEKKFKDYNRPENNCPKENPTTPPCSTYFADGNTAKRLGLTGFIAGGVLGLGAAGLFLWSAGAFSGSDQPQMALACSPLALGATCAWRF